VALADVPRPRTESIGTTRRRQTAAARRALVVVMGVLSVVG